MSTTSRSAVRDAVRHVAGAFNPDARLTILCENLEKHVQEIQMIADAAPDANGSVIDIGGGLGINMLALRRLGWRGRLVLVDKFTEYTADNRMGSSGAAFELLKEADVEVQQIDIWPDCNLPFDAGTFDVATTFDMVEHLPGHPLRQLTEMRRVLKPTGRCIVGAPNAISLLRRIHLASGRHPYMPFEEWVSDEYIYHYREYTAAEYRSLLERTGYNVVKTVFSHAVTMSRARTNFHRHKRHALAPVAFALRIAAAIETLVPSLRHTVYSVAAPALSEGSAVRVGRDRSNSAPPPS